MNREDLNEEEQFDSYEQPLLEIYKKHLTGPPSLKF